MTMIDSSKEIDYISNQVIRNNKIVTYSEVSQQLRVPFSRAKRIVYEFYRANKSKLSASFIIIGTKSGNKAVQFAPSEDKVDEELERFDEVKEVHIYAISPSGFAYSINDLVLSVLEKRIDYGKLEDYYGYGMIRGPELKPVDGSAGSGGAVSAAGVGSGSGKTKPSFGEPTTSTKTETTVKPEKKFNTGLTSGYVSRKAQKPSHGTDISKFVKDKRQRQEDPPKNQYKSRKLDKPAKQDKVVISDLNDTDTPDSDKMDIDGVVKMDADTKSKLDAMFDDDFSDEDLGPARKEPETKEPETKGPETKEQSKDANQERDSSVEVQESLNPTDSEVVEIPNPSKDSETVIESEKEQTPPPEYDEDGYLIHRAKPKPKPKKATRKQVPQPKPKPKTGGGKQSSLMNFFGTKQK